MPELIQPPEPQQFDFAQAAYHFSPRALEERRAVQTVVKTFDVFSSWRQTNHDPRWDKADKLYFGDVPRRTWPGSPGIPRSSLGVPISFDQIWTLYPIITRELFNRRPYWFDVEPTALSTPAEAEQLRAALAYQIDTPRDASGVGVTRELKNSVLEALMHGNCCLEVGWDFENNILFGEQVPLRDLYFDPGLAGPLIDKAQVVIRRKLISVDELQALRATKRFNVPPDAVLNGLAKGGVTHPGEQGVRHLASLRGENFSEGAHTNDTADPGLHAIELLQYWTNKHWVWVLGRKWLLASFTNPWGFKPFCYAPLFMVPGRGYGSSAPDVLAGEQELIQGITNARVDELSLGLIPPRTKSAVGSDPKNSPAWWPGLVEGSEDSSKVAVHFPTNITGQAFQEVSQSEARAGRRMGVSEMAQRGTPTPSNANRTAGGVQAQNASSLSRAMPLIEFLEDYLLTPFLYKGKRILDVVTQHQGLQQLPARVENGVATIIPREVLGAPVRFSITAGNRMVSRERLLPMLGPITQLIASETIQKAAAAQGQKFSFTEWNRFLHEATGTSKMFNFFEPQSPEDQQKQQQPSPDAQAKAQEAQQAAQVRIQIAQQKNQTILQAAQIESDSRAESSAEASALGALKLLMTGRKNAKATDNRGGGS